MTPTFDLRKSLVWIATIGAFFASARYIQIADQWQVYYGVSAALGAMGSVLWTRRLRSKPRLALSSRSFGPVTGSLVLIAWSFIAVRLANAAGGLAPPALTRGKITVSSNDPSSVQGNRWNHITVDLGQDRLVYFAVSPETMERVSSGRCVDVDIRPGLLGVDWCPGDCIHRAPRQSRTCAE